jgi:uncharacterized membrane-anchored protein YjiN (DUF445 family)
VNRHKATLILIVASSIYVLSYPFRDDNLIGGLIYSGSCASMIGGFADWWGINKLLKRRIPKNKQKIFDGLANMVSEELLSKKTLNEVIDQYDTSQLVIGLIKNNDEFENITKALKTMLEANIETIDDSEIKKQLSTFIISYLEKLDVHRWIVSVLEMSSKTEYENKIFDFILDQLIVFSQTEQFKDMLTKFIEQTRASYEGKSLKKKLIDGFKGSSANMALGIVQKTNEWLTNMKNKDNESRLLIKRWIYDKLEQFKSSEAFKLKVEQWKLELIHSGKVEAYIHRLIENIMDKTVKNESAYNTLFISIKKWMDTLDENTEAQRKVDSFVKGIIHKVIDEKHENIGKIVKENLNKYDETMLINLIESKVGNDLQLIRINGSIVGGIVGIIIFIIKYGLGV